MRVLIHEESHFLHPLCPQYSDIGHLLRGQVRYSGHNALQEYVSLLVGLATYAGAPSDQGADSSGVEPSEKALRTSLMRDAVTFEWRDAVFGSTVGCFA